jgi:hypothetical protein
MSRARTTKLDVASVVEVGIAEIFAVGTPEPRACSDLWRFSTESATEPPQKCTIAPKKAFWPSGDAWTEEQPFAPTRQRDDE